MCPLLVPPGLLLRLGDSGKVLNKSLQQKTTNMECLLQSWCVHGKASFPRNWFMVAYLGNFKVWKQYIIYIYIYMYIYIYVHIYMYINIRSFQAQLSLQHVHNAQVLLHVARRKIARHSMSQDRACPKSGLVPREGLSQGRACPKSGSVPR